MMAGTALDFQASELDTLVNVIGLTPTDPLNTFAEMWYQVFLWNLFSSLFVHIIAAIIAFYTLRKHKLARFFPALLLIMGVMNPITIGSVTSATIAFVYRAASYSMPPFYALVLGVGQTIIAATFGFTRILATL